MTRRQEWTWWGEWSGAFGDLGTLLPLAAALAISCGYGIGRLVLLWGLAYVATGLWYRVPVSVQPLKAMAVLAIAQGIDASTLSNAAFGYGVLMCALAASGMVERIRSLFSPGLVRGVQLGVGLVLARKALQLATQSDWFLGSTGSAGWMAMVIAGLTVVAILVARRFRGWNLTLPVIGLALMAGLPAGAADLGASSALVHPSLPSPLVWGELFLLLMLPQLPLTLANAVVAANDACHEFWPERSQRVTPTSLATSIGIGNLAMGLLGGFPICHGAGGIAAHHRFGGRTGRATIIVGVALVVAAVAPPVASLLLHIPVPVLSGLLMLVALEMAGLVLRPAPRIEVIVALVTGVTAFAFGHLAIGLAVGWVVHRASRPVSVSQPLTGGTHGNSSRH